VALSSTRTNASRAAVLAFLGTHGAASRAEIARSLEVSPALVTKLARELLADQLIIELTHSPSRGGRPAQLIGLASHDIGAIGVKVAPDHLTMVEVGIDGEVTHVETRDFEASSPHALATLVTAVSEVVKLSTRRTQLGIGVGIPGSVQEQSEHSVNSTQLGWTNVPLGSALQSATNLPVLIDNNVSALALAESLYGTGRGHDHFLVVTIGSGVGAGIVSHGSIIRGHSGNAGEIGHIPVTTDGPVCNCGATGCLEAAIKEESLVRQARSAGVIGPHDGIGALEVRGAAGDPRAQEVFANAGRLFGRAVAGVVNTLDPEIVIVLGEGAASWPLWAAGFEPAFRPALIPQKRGIQVVVEGWQDDRWAQGAACLILSTPFDDAGVSGKQGHLIRERLTTHAGAPS